MLVLSLGAQGLVLAEVFFFAVLHSGVLLPVCALIHLVLELVSAFDISKYFQYVGDTSVVCIFYAEELEFCF